MPGLARPVNRTSAFILYALLAAVVLFTGKKLHHYASDIKFNYFYLKAWEDAATQAGAKEIIFPEFTGRNHVEYMEKLIQLFTSGAISVPGSNTDRPYIYRISKAGSPASQTFVLCLENQIIVYGLPKTTFDAVDNRIDGETDTRKGRFKGKLQKDKEHYVGILTL